MASPSFDAFSAARALEAAGVERSQAEAITSAINHSGDYSTKADLVALEARMYRAPWIQGGIIVGIIATLSLLA